MLTFYADKLHIHSVLEIRMPANFSAFLLPHGREVCHKHHVMRIAHGNRGAMRWREAYRHGKLTAHLRLPHFHFKLKAMFLTRHQLTLLHSRTGGNGNLSGVALAHHVGGDTASA